MSEVQGENSVPLGRAGTGAAFILGRSPGPSALQLLVSGQLARAKAEREATTRIAKETATTAKAYQDNAKYDLEQDGSPYFAKPLQEKVYSKVYPALQEIYLKHQATGSRGLARLESDSYLSPVVNETKQSKAKTAYLTETLKQLQSDGLYDPKYATEHLAKALRGEDGTGLLPSQFDEQAWKSGLLGDANLYNEKEVITRAAKGLFPIISQRVAEAGRIGGEHTASQVRGRLVAFDGKGHPVLNADGSPKLNLTADTENLLDSDPLFKLKTDARVAAYEKARAENVEARKADPSIPEMPRMSRRGHHAVMLGPLAFYDTSLDEGLNAQARAPRATKDNPNKVQVRDFVGARQSDYLNPSNGTQRTNHYAELGQTFGSATKPYVEVSAPTAHMTIIGQDGQPSTLNQIKGGGNTKVKAQARVYTLYTKTGKRLGSEQPFATDQEAADFALKLVREYPKPQDLELRVEGRGTLVDDERVAGDGLGGSVPMKLVPASGNKPAHMAPDNSVRKTERTVLFPITQEVDDQLSRSTNGEWNRYKHSAAQAQLMREVVKRGGKFVSPYSHDKRTSERATSAKQKPQRPAFLQPTAKKSGSTRTTPNTPPSADPSGGML
jgi:hypothetical protein